MEEQDYEEKNKEFGFGYVKFERLVILPMVEQAVGYIRLESKEEVYNGVLNWELISKQCSKPWQCMRSVNGRGETERGKNYDQVLGDSNILKLDRGP